MIRIEIKGSRGSGKTRLAHFIANALRAGSHGATSVTVDGSDKREQGSNNVTAQHVSITTSNKPCSTRRR